MSPGPIPKRSSQRRRRNTSDPVGTAPAAEQVEVPEPDPQWHPAVIRWFKSLTQSGQSVFYEPSDYAVAFVLAEVLSRELLPRPVVVGRGASARVELLVLAPSPGIVGAWLRGCTELLVAEGARRRYRLELVGASPSRDESGDLAWIDIARRRLRRDENPD